MKTGKERKAAYFLLCCGCFTISFNVAAIVAAVPAISTGLGVPDVRAADIIPAYMIPYGIGALMYAPLTRHFSYKRILGVSLLCYALACWYCAGVDSVQGLVYGRVVMGLAGAGVIPLGLIIIGQFFDKNVRGRLVGMFFTSSFAASIAGIVLSGLVSWRWLFTVPALLGGVTAGAIGLMRLGPFTHVRGLNVDYLRALGQVPVRRVFFFITAISFLYYGVHQWYGVYLARRFSPDQLMISSLLLIPLFTGAAGQMLGGHISDRKDRYTACLAGLALLALGTILLSGRYPLAVTAGLMGMVAFGWTIGHNGVSTVLTDFPDRVRPEIASLNSSLRFMAGGLGFKLSKLIVERGLSFEMNFLSIGLIMLGSGFFLRKVIPQG